MLCKVICILGDSIDYLIGLQRNFNFIFDRFGFEERLGFGVRMYYFFLGIVVDFVYWMFLEIYCRIFLVFQFLEVETSLFIFQFDVFLWFRSDLIQVQLFENLV